MKIILLIDAQISVFIFTNYFEIKQLNEFAWSNFYYIFPTKGIRLICLVRLK